MSGYRLDAGARSVDDGRVLIGGSPLKIFRLSDAGADVLRRLTGDEFPPASAGAVARSAGERRLVDRLVDAGVLHPRPGEPGPGAVSVVVPAHDPPAGALEGLVARMRFGPNPPDEIVIVDDAGRVALGPIDGARVVRLDGNLGPGGARNRGVALTSGELVAFVDSDVEPDDGWLSALLGHFGDPRVGLVAARVRSRPGPSVRERYERWRSPLDLGGEPARVRCGTRVGYVPGAAVVVRRRAFDEVGGFDEALRFGEDVDLVWRLDAAGWRCRYEPASTVVHEPRPGWAAWARQRFSYGSSAAPLARRHRRALAPARVSGWTAASWGLAAAGQPVAGLGLAAVTTAALPRKLTGLRHPGAEALRLAGLGHLFGGRILANACWRAWWPITVALAVVSRRARRVALLAAVVPPLIDWWRERPALDPVTAVAVRLADDLSYGAGVWAGVIGQRDLAAILPEFTSWPGRKPAGERLGGSAGDDGR